LNKFGLLVALYDKMAKFCTTFLKKKLSLFWIFAP